MSADIADIGSPDAAPRTLRFSETNERIFQAERRASYPGGHSKEQGGTIVADAAGRLQIQNLGGTGSTAGTFSPDLTPKEPAKYTVVGILHTHPYDRTEGSYNGVSFSGGDIAYLIKQPPSDIGSAIGTANIRHRAHGANTAPGRIRHRQRRSKRGDPGTRSQAPDLPTGLPHRS